MWRENLDLKEKINQIKKKLISDAKLLEESGVFSIVLECIESSTSMAITKSLKIPTIGIGSSSNCDGQVLVTDDMIGLNPNSFRFVKKYGNVIYKYNVFIVFVVHIEFININY